jgi:hypothetical protein
MANLYKNRRLLSGSTGTVLPTGSTANRPNNPVFGLIRYNTDTGLIEYFNGIIYVSISNGAPTYTVDNFTGDGSQTVFTMSVEVSDATQITVFVGSVYQQANTVYTVNGGYDITFTDAPPLDSPVNVVHTLPAG